MMDRHIKAPLNDDEVKMLKAGDYVYTVSYTHLRAHET